jgi:hypothetical protein
MWMAWSPRQASPTGLFVGVALVIVVCCANRNDLPAIIRAIMRVVDTPGDDRRPKL